MSTQNGTANYAPFHPILGAVKNNEHSTVPSFYPTCIDGVFPKPNNVDLSYPLVTIIIYAINRLIKPLFVSLSNRRDLRAKIVTPVPPWATLHRGWLGVMGTGRGVGVVTVSTSLLLFISLFSGIFGFAILTVVKVNDLN